MESLRIGSEPEADPQDVAVIEAGLNEFNRTASVIRRPLDGRSLHVDSLRQHIELGREEQNAL
jgi:hypothetical protein